MYTGRAISCYTINKLMLTKLACSISRAGHTTTLRYWDHTINRLGITEQKAKKMLPIVQWMFAHCATFSKSLNPRNIEKIVLDILVCIRFDPVWKQFLDICIRLRTHYPAGYQTGKPDSVHLLARDERSDIFQASLLFHALRLLLLLRLRKMLKHQLRLLLTLRKLPSNPY